MSAYNPEPDVPRTMPAEGVDVDTSTEASPSGDPMTPAPEGSPDEHDSGAGDWRKGSDPEPDAEPATPSEGSDSAG